MGSLILCGGGNASETLTIHKSFIEMIDKRKPLLYIPIAGDPSYRSYEESFDYIKSVFEPLGVSNFDMWTEVHHKTLEDLKPFSAIYIGGGDAERLWKRLKKSRFNPILREYIKYGGIIYGQSAGAMIFGKEILNVEKHCQEFHLSLNLVQSHSLHCHYVKEEERLVQTTAKDRGSSIVALPNGAALHVTQDNLNVLGEEPAYIFDRNGKRTLKS